MLTLADIIEGLTGIRPQEADRTILAVVIDSRQASKGSLFVALEGEHSNGHDFVQDAFSKGAAFALVQCDFSGSFPQIDLRGGLSEISSVMLSETPLCLRVENSLGALQQIASFWRRRMDVRVIGITGSVGKSTTKELVAAVLEQRFRTLKNPGNLNNEIGLPLALLHLNKEHKRAVLEMGFYVPGEIKFLCDIALPQVGVVTNVEVVHAERAGSQEAIARGKAELVQALPAAPKGVAILNHDDPWVRQMANQTQARSFFYGLSQEADLWADQVESLGLDGIRFQLHYRNEVIHLRVPLIGRHSVHTVLRAAAVGLVEGLTWQEIVAGLRSGQAQLRLVAVRAKNGALILDDTYNASPTSTLAALNLLDELEGRKVAVLGDMLELGQYERQGHEMVGLRAAQVVNELVTVGERGHLIAAAAQEAGFPGGLITELLDSQQAIGFLRGHLSSKDVVLVKGSRGMHMEGIVSALEEEE